MPERSPLPHNVQFYCSKCSAIPIRSTLKSKCHATTHTLLRRSCSQTDQALSACCFPIPIVWWCKWPHTWTHFFSNLTFQFLDLLEAFLRSEWQIPDQCWCIWDCPSSGPVNCCYSNSGLMWYKWRRRYRYYYWQCSAPQVNGLFIRLMKIASSLWYSFVK